MDGCCEKGNEPPGSTKHRGILELLRSYLLPKKDPAPRYYLLNISKLLWIIERMYYVT